MSKQIIQRYTGLENAAGRAKSQYAEKILNTQIPAESDKLGKQESKVRFEEVLLDCITPRSINQYSQTRIQRLAKSIRDTNNRLINPITLVRISDLNIDGEVVRKYIRDGLAFVQELRVEDGSFVRDISLEELDDVIKKREEERQASAEKGVKYIRKTKLALKTDLQYIIVAGERRYRAITLLRDEEEQKEHPVGWKNPFLTITANILTPAEAANEKVFYEESNTQSRQLTPEEAMRHFETAIKAVENENARYNMLIEMKEAGVEFKHEIPSDQKLALRMFRMPAYCVYYLETELGIQGWTETSVKGYLTVLNNSCDEVKEAVFATTYSLREAKRITKFDFEEQRRLLQLWLSGDTKKYNKLIDQLSVKEIPAARRVTNKSAGRNIDRIIRAVESELDKVKDDEKYLKSESRQLILRAIKQCEKLTEELQIISDSVKKL